MPSDPTGKVAMEVLIIRAGTRAVLFLGGLRHDYLARSKTRHGPKYFGPCRHDTNTRVMPCLGSGHDGLYGTTCILDLAWTSTT